MLYRGLRTLNKLDIVEEAERVAVAKITIPISDFNFPEILLNLIKAKAFWASLDFDGEKL
jgi:hypothetical protein